MFQDTDNGQKFFAYTKHLHQIMECPICLEVAKAPLRQCHNGHLTCSSCVSQQVDKICSLCQQPLLTGNPTCLNQLLESLPRLCRYVDQGCKEVCVGGDDHASFCDFKTTKCREFGCNQEVKITQLQTHYEEEHPARWRVTTILSGSLKWPDFSLDKSNRDDIPIFLNRQVFFLNLRYSTKEKKLKFTLHELLTLRHGVNFCLTIKLQNEGVAFCKTIKPIRMNDDHDESSKGVTDTMEDEYFMTVPQCFLLKLLDKRNNLYCDYNFYVLY